MRTERQTTVVLGVIAWFSKNCRGNLGNNSLMDQETASVCHGRSPMIHPVGFFLEIMRL